MQATDVTLSCPVLDDASIAAAMADLRLSLPDVHVEALDIVWNTLDEQLAEGKRDESSTAALKLIAASYLALKARH